MRSYSLMAVALVCAAVLAACGGTASKPRATDGGTGTTGASGTSGDGGGCTDSSQCSAGSFCISAKCGSCRGARPITCPAGTFCAQDGDCSPLGGSTGSSGGTGTTGSTGSSPCTHRSDCPGAEACLEAPDAGGYCSAPFPDAGCASSDQCVKAYICQSHDCVFGCQNNLDCHGTAQPVCIVGNPGHCGACTSSTQCLANENCASNGQCVAAASCTSADTCNGLGCVAGSCGPCTAAGDCSNGNTCDTVSGRCVTGASGCANDAACASQHNGSPAWWCAAVPDGGASVCRLGCVPDAQCGTPQTGCCNVGAGQTCNTATHSCQQASTNTTATNTNGTGTTTAGNTTGTTGSCGTFNCQTCYSAGQQCDITNCVCIGAGTNTTGTGTTAGFGTSGFGTSGFGTSGFGTGGLGGIGGTSGGAACSPTGAQGEPCGSSCGCNSGLNCTDGSSTYSTSSFQDILSCEVAAQGCSIEGPTLLCEP